MKYQRNPQTNLQTRIIKKKSLRGRKDFQCRYVYQYHILFNDYSMETLAVKAVVPPTVEGSDFGYNFSKICKIYVPDTSVNIYKENSWWSQYASRIHPLSMLPKE